MCNERCGINVYLENEKIVKIEGNKDHYWNKGRLCIKGGAGVDLFNASDRLLKPLKKVNGKFVEINLEDALDEIAEKMKRIKDKYGARSLSIWKGESLGFAQEEEIVRRFIHAIGSPNYFSCDSMCFVGVRIAYSLVAGSLARPDFENSKCILLWGSNPPNTHPVMARQIIKARNHGAKIIVIDPRFSEIARQADIFVQIKPGTDGCVAHSIMRHLIEKEAYDKKFIAQYTKGFAELAEYVQNFSDEYVEKETGIKSKIIEDIVDCIISGSPRVINFVGNALEHNENSVNNIRAVACIVGLIGSFDQMGGNFMQEGLRLRKLTLYDEIPLRHLNPIGADIFPVLYDFRKECHTMTAMNTILSGRPYSLKSMIVIGGNPVLTNPNSNKVKRALKSLDLLVVRDLFISETAKLADYVLPAATYLERSELHCHGLYQIVTLTNRICTIPGVQDEYQFIHDLAHRLGIGKYFPWANENELNRWLLEPTMVNIETLKRHPEGYRYKPLRYKKWEDKFKKGEKPFNTPSGKVEFYSVYLNNLGYDSLPVYHSPDYVENYEEDYPFVMITGARKLVYYHSRNRNIKRLRNIIPTPEVEVNPGDAEKLKLSDKDIVIVKSKIGSMEIPVKIKQTILPGVVQITHGWKEANVNLITHDDRFDHIDGFPLLKSVKVNMFKK